MIYFQDSKKHTSFKELLSEGFGDNYFFQKTYIDQDCTTQECHPARRSFPALLEICQTYYPDTTKEELASHLLENYGYRFCTDIMKLVFMNADFRGHGPNRVGVDGYSLKMIEELAKDYKS